MTLHFSRMDVSPSTCTTKISNTTAGSGFPNGETSDSLSIIKMLEQVMLQVEYNCFVDLRLKRIDPLYKELCLIIAEVLILDKNSVIKINGSNMSAHLVQEVYSQIRNDHVCLVFNNFHNVSQRIFNKKAYLRTALYNTVFEIESHYANDIKATD